MPGTLADPAAGLSLVLNNFSYSTSCHFKALLSPKLIQEQRVEPVRQKHLLTKPGGCFSSIAPDLKSLQFCKEAAS